MVNVEILTDFKVEATSSVYIKGWVGEVSNELAERHGAEGTGMLELSEKSPTPLTEVAKAVKPKKGK